MYDPKSKRVSVSIVVPVFNEGGGVELFHEALCEAIDQLKDVEFEMLYVDDGSVDDTLKRLLLLARTDRRVHVIELSRNFGKEAALSAGLDAASGDAAIPIDADLQDPPELIPDLIREWQNGAEVVLARREDRASDTFLKRSTAALFYRVHNWISAVQIPENAGDFRLMDRKVLDALKQLPERQRFMKGLFAWVGFRTAVVGYVRSPRKFGTTKFSAWKLWNFAVEGITSFSTAPLKICMHIGALMVIATLAYSVFIVLRTLFFGTDVPGYSSLLVAILFLGSMQLIGLGLLGEYVGRIYMETKQRPRYVVRKHYWSSGDGT